jgi:hypothetical protein
MNKQLAVDERSIIIIVIGKLIISIMCPENKENIKPQPPNTMFTQPT